MDSEALCSLCGKSGHSLLHCPDYPAHFKRLGVSVCLLVAGAPTANGDVYSEECLRQMARKDASLFYDEVTKSLRKVQIAASPKVVNAAKFLPPTLGASSQKGQK